MATKTHGVDMYASGPGLVKHDIDMFIHTIRPEGDVDQFRTDEQRWQYRYGPEAAVKYVLDWHEWTIDSSEDWDSIYTAGMVIAGNPNYGGRTEWFIHGVGYAASAGNALTVKYWDMQPDPARGVLSTSFEIFSPVSGPNVATKAEHLTSKAGTISGHKDPEFESQRTGQYQLFVDSNDNIWTVWWGYVGQVATIQKKNTSNNAFRVVGTRNIQEWDWEEPDGTGQISRWRIVQEDDVLHIAWWDSNGGGDRNWKMFYSQWDMDTESWLIEDEEVADLSSELNKKINDERFGLDIVVRSTGEVVIWSEGAERTQGSRTGTSFAFYRRTGVDTWTSATTWTNSETDWETYGADQLFRCEIGKDDRVHFFYSGRATTNYILWHRSLNSSNVLDTEQLVESNSNRDNIGEGYQDGSFVEGFPAGKSIQRIEVGSDVRIWLFTGWTLDGKSDSTFRTWEFLSEADPTITGATFAHTDGIHHGAVGTPTFTEHWGTPGIMFVAQDGTLNVMRNEFDTVRQSLSGDLHEIYDGVGPVIYTMEDVGGTGVFDRVRQRFGLSQQPRNVAVQQGFGNWTKPSSVWEWCWPSPAFGDHTSSNLSPRNAGNFMQQGGYFATTTQEYVWYSMLSDDKHYVAPQIVVVPLKAIPKIFVTHDVDMITQATEIPEHTTDMRLVNPAGEQLVDHFLDMLPVDRITTDHDVDMFALNRVIKEHGVDMLLSKVEIITVTFDIDDTGLSASTELVETAGIEGIRQLSRKRYSTGRGIVRKDG